MVPQLEQQTSQLPLALPQRCALQASPRDSVPPLTVHASKLHVHSVGNGPNLALLHGWGLHSGLWGEALVQLSATFRVHSIDLPGHGHSGWDPAFASLDGFANAVIDVLPERCILVGWSLGGLVALRVATALLQTKTPANQPLPAEPVTVVAGRPISRTASRPVALVLICTTPKFVADKSWPCAVAPATLDDFARRLAADYAKTVRDFLALQIQGEARALSLLRQMNQMLQGAPAPYPEALQVGLDVLRTTDLRAQLKNVTLPSLVISGALDRLTPAAAGRYLAQHLGHSSPVSLPTARAESGIPNSQERGDGSRSTSPSEGADDELPHKPNRASFQLFKKAAHAPFLSDPTQFVDLLSTFAAHLHFSDQT